MSSAVLAVGNVYGVRVSEGTSGDGKRWRGYEPPVSPEPEPDKPPEPQRDAGWRVYGDRADPPGLRAGTGQSTSVPAPPYGTMQRPSRRGPRPAGGWSNLTGWKKLRLFAGGLLLVGWMGSSVVGALVGDDGDHSMEAVEVFEVPRFDMLQPATLARFERNLERQLGTTEVTRVEVFEDVVVVEVPVGDGEVATYNWRGRHRLTHEGTHPSDLVVFDLAGVELADVAKAGRVTTRMVRRPEDWWVTVKVAEGNTRPLIEARALRESGAGAVTVIDADGTVVDQRSWTA